MKSIIYTELAPSPIGPYSQAVKAGNMLYVSGQIAIDPETNELIEGSIADETHRVMLNIKALLSASGYSFADIVKTSIFLSDMTHFAQVNDVYGSYFNSDFPARETVAVLGLPKNVNVEISVTAYKGQG
ncbi:MAG: RidA family protein [Daejeonella sp.]